MAGFKPTIYLRNVFKMKWDPNWDKDGSYLKMFLTGKEKFIQTTKGLPEGHRWRLVAAFGEWPLLKDMPVVQPSFEMVQIWRLDRWDTLYDTMVDLSETRWYRDLGRSLDSEQQELLINAGVLEPPIDRQWTADNDPGYAYVYEVSRANEGQTHAYLREISWFSAQMRKQANWKLVWWATQVTAQPAQISVLWRVPRPGDGQIPQDLVSVVRKVNDEKRSRYNDQMLRLLKETKRRIYYPIFTEYLDQQIP